MFFLPISFSYRIKGSWGFKFLDYETGEVLLEFRMKFEKTLMLLLPDFDGVLLTGVLA